MCKINRTFCVVALIFSIGASISSAAMVTLNALNDSVGGYITANDGAGDAITSDGFYLAQFNVTFTPTAGSPTTFNTFCVDLFHNSSDGQQYAVNPRSDLATAFANGSQIAEIYDTYGTTDLTSNPDQAAAVQIAIWDLSLNNHNPTSFGVDGDGSYSSGDESVFSITLGTNPDAGTIAGLVNTYLQGAVGATAQGDWLDAAAAGTGLDRGQSLLIPPTVTGISVPEPSTVTLLLAAAGGLIARRRRA